MLGIVEWCLLLFEAVIGSLARGNHLVLGVVVSAVGGFALLLLFLLCWN
jgi:hypothetical protein